MPWIAAGASIAGGLLSSSSSKKAAGAQAAATADANAITRDQNRLVRADQTPYRTAGANATNKLAYLLGTGPRGDSEADLLAELRPQFRSYDPNDTDGYDSAGLMAAVAAAQAGRRGQTDADYGSLMDTFTGEDLESEPGYQFGLQQGQRALDNRLAASGSYFSGGALKAASRYNQDYAGTKFGEAFNRDSANKTRAYNFLTGQQSIGQNAAAQTGNAGMNMAQQVGANTTALGNAQGAATIAQGNAWSGALNNAGGAYTQNALIDKILAGNKGWGQSWGAAMNNGTAYG